MRKVFTLFLAIFITALSSVNISAQTCGTATRTAQDCKAGTVDAVGWAMQQFFNDGSTAGWNFEPGAVFQENADGTANLTGIITQYGSSPKRSFNVVVNFTGKSKLTTGTPETNNLCPVIATSAWQYYTLSSGSLTGVSGTMCEGAKLTLSQHMMPSQYGIGAANQCSEQTNLGLTGWFEYQIISQPSNGWLLINSYPGNPVIGQADICIRLSGTPTSCGGGSSPPIANPDVASTPQNTPVTIASLNNDILNGGTGAVLTLVSNPSYGTVQIVNGQFVYTPNPGFSGTDVFTYKIVASNGTSNTTTVSVTVTKTVNLCDNDIIPPVFANCPSNISLTTTSYCAIASWTAPTATDNCSIPTVIQTAGGSNGSCFSVGTTIVTYTATDAKGNKATCSFTVTVINNCPQPPTPYGFTFIGRYGNNFYYRLNGGEESYYKGKEDAKKAGGYLACPKESKEKEYVRGICGTNNYWLDMEREGSSDKWKCTDGSYASYYNWSNDDNRNYDYSKKHAKGYNDGYYRSCKDEEYGSVIIVIPCGGIPVPICTQPTTPSGYTYIGLYGSNYYYRLNGGEESYYKGKEDAKKAGGYLACPKESKEKEYVRGICGTNNYWLDMEREGSSDKWKCTDGSYASYYNWSNDDNRNYDYSKKHAKGYNDGYYRSCKDEEYGSVIIVIPCGGIPLPPVPVCNANFDQNKYYKIVNKKSGKCLDVEGGRKDKYAAVEQYDYFGGDNQKWYIIPTSDGYCKMYAKHSNKILSCSYSWNGSQLYQDEDKKDNDKDNSHGEKEWKIECDKDGYKITHRMSGRSCHEGNGIYNGSHCQLWDWNSGDEERYDLVDVTNDQQQGQHFQNTKVLSISATVEANKTRLEWLNNTGATNDFFQVEKLNATTGNFEAIANVPSLKTTVMESYVSFDVKPTEGDNFYRINAISLDGSNNISNVQKVNFKGLAGNISVFPNPADEVLNIDLTNYKGKAVTLFVYNRLGQTVITQQIENVVDGITQVDISNQQVGNYLVRVVSKGKNDQTKSFILNK